jgi:hypothetical protein
VFPAGTSFALGLSVAYETSFHLYWDGSTRIRPTKCGLCTVGSLTLMPAGFGGGIHAGPSFPFQWGPATDPSGLEGFSLSVGAGGMVNWPPIPGPGFIVGGSWEHDLVSGQNTISIDTQWGVGAGVYFVVRTSGNITACDWSHAKRMTKMWDHIKNIRENFIDAVKKIQTRFIHPTPRHQTLTVETRRIDMDVVAND